jgi:hypothetical protein
MSGFGFDTIWIQMIHGSCQPITIEEWFEAIHPTAIKIVPW